MSRAAKIAWLIVAIVVANVATAAFVWAQAPGPQPLLAWFRRRHGAGRRWTGTRAYVTDNMTQRTRAAGLRSKSTTRRRR